MPLALKKKIPTEEEEGGGGRWQHELAKTRKCLAPNHRRSHLGAANSRELRLRNSRGTYTKRNELRHRLSETRPINEVRQTFSFKHKIKASPFKNKP